MTRNIDFAQEASGVRKEIRTNSFTNDEKRQKSSMFVIFCLDHFGRRLDCAISSSDLAYIQTFAVGDGHVTYFTIIDE